MSDRIFEKSEVLKHTGKVEVLQKKPDTVKTELRFNVFKLKPWFIGILVNGFTTNEN